MKKLFLLLIPFVSLSQQADVVKQKDLSQISFGSCARQGLTNNQLWSEINYIKPDLWIWLGDNVYSDGVDMVQRRKDYDLQKSHKGYQQLLKQTEVIGIWDDHDYGLNDGGKEYPKKDESKEELFNFLDIDENNPAWSRQGTYQSYTYIGKEGTVKIILLDSRYFRDSLKWNNPGTPEKEALINETGDILGEKQWTWFEEQLSEEGVDLFIIGSSIQVIPTEHRWEKWANFPQTRKKLLETISNGTKAPLIIISGDRHLSEISKIELEGNLYPIWELTSSSLNSPTSPREEPNQYRIGKKVHPSNFANLKIDWGSGKPILELTYYGKDNEVLKNQKIEF